MVKDRLILKLNSYMREKSKKENEEYKKTALSPTDAFKCPRKVYYSWKKVESINTPETTLRIFDLGDAIHQRWQKIFDEMKIQIKNEFRIETEYKGIPIHGYVDSICIIDNEPYIIEIKSQKDWNGIHGTDYLKRPKLEHEGQLQLYLHFTGIKKGILLYENKNTSELKEFEVEYDESFVKEILKDFEKLYAQIQLSDLPDKIKGANIEYYPCSFCEFRKHCFDTTGLEQQNLVDCGVVTKD
jgi:CRISPR/Cas system-associated exonuclease Cas4 (RecB family)